MYTRRLWPIKLLLFQLLVRVLTPITYRNQLICSFNTYCSAFRTGFSPNDIQNMNRITCLIHSVRGGSPGPPNVADSVTFPVGIVTPAAVVAP